MAKRETQTLSFTPQQAAFLGHCVKSGRYQSASEVVREALRLLEMQEAQRMAEREQVRRLLQEGARQIDTGHVVASEDVFGALTARHEAIVRRDPTP